MLGLLLLETLVDVVLRAKKSLPLVVWFAVTEAGSGLVPVFA